MPHDVGTDLPNILSPMNDWFRSLTALGAGFMGVVACTLGLAMVIVPDPAVSSQTSDATPAASETDDIPATMFPITTVEGGTLTLSGDVQDTFTLSTVLTDGRYGLEGDGARLFFATDPPAIEQMNLNGLSFFPDPDECIITPGVLDAALGVATAELLCAEIADVRGNGVVTIAGTLRLAGNVIGMRGDLPPAGGEVEVGAETLVFTEASLFVGRGQFVSVDAFSQRVTTSDEASYLMFDYDPNSGVLTLASVILDGDALIDLGEDGCPLTTREIGQLNPRATVVEHSFACPAVEADGLGSVVVSGSLVVEQSTDR